MGTPDLGCDEGGLWPSAIDGLWLSGDLWIASGCLLLGRGFGAGEEGFWAEDVDAVVGVD